MSILFLGKKFMKSVSHFKLLQLDLEFFFFGHLYSDIFPPNHSYFKKKKLVYQVGKNILEAKLCIYDVASLH